MATKAINWLAILADVIRRHPKTSATIAFNLGVFAAEAAKSRKLRNGVVDIPAKLIELVPSMKDIGAYVPMMSTAKTAPKRKAQRTAARKTTRKAVKRVARRAAV